ncbi:unnamed protein product [Thelazia callipaeda]|uniref:glucuronosyltransferase n=1 Tax=Thelazia callipaeda TaxID=103827 RepID=A0A0N5CY29_THECL|nr:unnamed protein product [Thelazia callipaeda]
MVAIINVAITLVFFTLSQAAKVLIMPSSLFPVHRFTMRVLAEELIRRKHDVTWFEYGFLKTGIHIAGEVEEIWTKVEPSNSEIGDLYLYHNHSLYSHIWNTSIYDEAQQTTAWLTSIDMCKQVLSVHKQKFDSLVARNFTTVILDDLYNPCGLLLVALKNIPYIYWSMTSLRTESAWAIQSPSTPSYLPVLGTGLSDDLTFFQRFYNFASYLRAIYIHHHLILRRIDKLFKAISPFGFQFLCFFQDYYPNKLPSSFYIERNASVNFINTPQVFDFARPYMPRVVFIGGIHCRKAVALEKDLYTFVNKANWKHGFVLFTTGFTAQWNLAPAHVVESFVQAFAAMSEIYFIWQYNGPFIRDLPENVFIAEWLPQQDLLGHPKVRAHISHGGLNSVIESVWHGVPVIGYPLTTSGYDNLLRLVTRKVGIMLEKQYLSKDSIQKSVEEIYDIKYKTDMLIFQDMVTNVPYTELNHSVFWVEFIERHSKVSHSRSAVDELNLLQYFLVDIILFVICTMSAFMLVIYIAVRYVIRMWHIFPNNRNAKLQKKQD